MTNEPIRETNDMRRNVNCLSGLVVLLTIAGCGDKPASQASTSWIDSSITRFHPLGWLGGRAHPATRTVEVTDDELHRIVLAGENHAAVRLPGIRGPC